MPSLRNFFRSLMRGFLGHRLSPNSAARVKLRPIPVVEWACFCSRTWSDEPLSAVCKICDGRFERVSPITRG
jgi:hypothetical protein